MRRTIVNISKPPAFRVELGSGFILFFALVWFFDESGFLGALIPAILVHELGHIVFLLFFGARPTRLKITLPGFKIDYAGTLSETQELLAAFAGPALGLLFSFLCASLGRYWDNDYLLLCSGLGFIINIFNFLPAEPLDGGRVLGFVLRLFLSENRAISALRMVGLVVSFLLLVLGLYLIVRGAGVALFLAGLWLLILQRHKLVNIHDSV